MSPSKASAPLFDLKGRSIWVAGHNGMVGSALVRALDARGLSVLTSDRSVDLRRQDQVEAWMSANRPDVVIAAAAKVGGILANATYPADFLYDNLAMAANVIHAAALLPVSKLLFLGSTCVYPKFAEQPIREEALLTGALEPTNEWYAIAKIAGLKLAQAYRRQHGYDFISAMPTNLYGPNDNFSLENSHVLPALMRKIHAAKAAGAASVEIWGTGTARREFLHVDDLAAGLLHLIEYYSDELHINVGTGEDVCIADLARIIADVVGYKGAFHFDRSKPDGTLQKRTNSSRLKGMGWNPRYDLRSGIEMTYDWYRMLTNA